VISNALFIKYLDKNQTFEKRIFEHPDEISFDLFSTWRFNQQKMGEYLTDVAFCAVAKKYDIYILANPVNPASYAHFIRSDVQSKTFTIRGRTLNVGMRGGFLESESGMKPLNFWIQGQRFYAVEREGKECLVRRAIASDRILTASCYEEGSFIVSDVDLVSIFSHKDSNKPVFDPMYGELTVQERTIIQDVNRYFQALVSSCYKLAVPSSFKLIAHGPANHFSNSKVSHLRYPMKICTPDSSIEFLEYKFLDFHREMRKSGYYADLNSKWEF